MEREDPDELIPCPFEPVHMLQRKRMPYHIIKCRKNQPQKHFRVCPFNHRHVVHHRELESHLQTCPDQGIVEREIIHRQNLSAGVTPVQKGYTDVPVSSFIPPEPTENWDTTHVVVEVGEYNTQSSGTESDSSQISGRQRHADMTCDRPVHEPPQPRLPKNSDLAVQLAASAVLPPQSRSPPRGRGRGRGRGLSPVKVGGPKLPLVRGVHSNSPPRIGLGRGRGLFQVAAMATESHTNGPASDAAQQKEELERRQSEDKELEEAAKMKKRDRKLKKMLRQILELEEKLAKGEVLDKDQLAKISRKADVLHELSRSQHEPS